MINNIDAFLTVLEKGYCVHLTNNGDWAIKPSIPGLRFLADINLTKCFIAQMEQLESVPVEFNKDGSQPVYFLTYIKMAEHLEQRCAKFPNWLMSTHLNSLKRHKIALLYRLEKENGGLNPEHYSLPIRDKLISLAQEWKKEQAVFWDPSLTESDKLILEKLTRYSAFVDLLLGNTDLMRQFFNWALRDGIAVEPFILFPSHQQKIVDVGLHSRIGAVDGKALKVQKLPFPGCCRKILTLPFEGKDVNILEETEVVVLKESRYVTVNEVFEAFRKKYLTVGDIEYFADGVYNWDGHRSRHVGDGHLKYLDLTNSEWWRKLPVFKRLTIEEAKIKYGSGMDGSHWCISAKAAREIPTMTYEKTHAYLEVTVPNGKGYNVYNFGKIAFECPVTRWGEISTFASTVPATISYPDENAYYTHRQHAGCFFIVGPEIGKLVMTEIAEDMQLARENRVVFQIETENCGRWIQEILEKYLGKQNVPNIYKVNLVHAEPVGFAKVFWAISRSFPEFYQGRALALCHTVFAPWRGEWVIDKNGKRVKKCLTRSSFWKDGEVFLPTFLHHQCEEKRATTFRHISIYDSEMIVDGHKKLDLYQDSA